MSGGITAAVIGGTALVGSAYLSSQAAKSAAQTQADAASQATSAQQAALEQQNRLSEPYRAAGTAAQNKLMKYLGVNPNAPTAAYGPSGAPSSGSALEKTADNFDPEAYLALYPDVKAQLGRPGVESAWAHYQNYGHIDNRQFTAKPGVEVAAAAPADFDKAAYLAANPDVAKAGIDPWVHYTEYGKNEGRQYTVDPDAGKYETAEFGGVQGFDPASLFRNFSETDFKADPGYAFRLKEGLNAMNASAAARGGLISGNALKAGQQYGQDMASQEYQNAYNRFAANRAFQGQEFGNAFNRFQTERANTLSSLQALSAQGQAAAAGQAANIGNFGAQQASNLIGAGNAQAAGQIGSANAYSNAVGQGIGMYQTNQLLNRFAPSGQSSYTTRTGGAAPVYDYSTPYSSTSG